MSSAFTDTLIHASKETWSRVTVNAFVRSQYGESVVSLLRPQQYATQPSPRLFSMGVQWPVADMLGFPFE